MSISGNIFEAEECSGEINEAQILPRTSYSLGENEVLPVNPGILTLLGKLLEGQKKMEEKMSIMEEKMDKLLANQLTLSRGQAAISNNQQEIANKIMVIEADVASKADIMAQSKILMECKVGTKRMQASLYRMTGETYDKALDEIASLLPLRTIEAVEEVEGKMDSPDFVQGMISYVFKIKGASEDVGSVIRDIFTDDLLEGYNWDGRWGKRPLGILLIFNNVIRNVFQNLGALAFDQGVKKAVERAHHRVKQKRYVKAQK